MAGGETVCLGAVSRRGYKKGAGPRLRPGRVGAATWISFGFQHCSGALSQQQSSESLVEMKANGFEVNVHGLKHVGKLFQSKQIFDRQAVKINQYLKEWESTGFTSPSMNHRAEWLHGLDITHSKSTFETDPFEP